MRKIEQLLGTRIMNHGIFWSWNLIFLILLIFIEVETGALFHLIQNAFIGYTPFDFAIYSLLILLIPPLSIVFGFLFWNRSKTFLLEFFYGVELPIILLLILRISVFRELTPGTSFIFMALAFGILTFAIHLFPKVFSKNKGAQYGKGIGLVFLFVSGLYLASVLFIYSLPLAAFFFQELVSLEWLRIFSEGFWVFLFLIFFFLTSCVFLGLPIALLILYLRTPFRFYKTHGLPKMKMTMWIGFSASIGLLFLLNSNQPQEKAMAFFEDESFDMVKKAEFQNQQNALKKGLLNAYLSPYRYVSTQESSHSIFELYKDAFNAEDQTAQEFQNVFNFLMTPFLYNGDFREDPLKAKMLYEKYFDADLQETESEAILAAMSSTWDVDGQEAGVLNINQEKVLLAEQHIDIKEKMDLAEIEIHEIYQNQTFRQQEIFYFFELPPNAALTGLWLSDKDDIPKRYGYRVSPRGAAQEVYKREVQRRVDPSLLEQVGPNQYRLRAFPIEPKTKNYRKDKESFTPGGNFHLWLSYTVLKNEKGYWPNPKLLEKRNVYWNKDSKLFINSIPFEREEKEWLPKMKQSGEAVISSHKTALNDSISMVSEPFNIKNKDALKSGRIAVLVDASFSMKEQSETLLNTMDSLYSKGFNPKDVEFFLINDTLLKIKAEDFTANYLKQNHPFFGRTSILEMLYSAKGHLKEIDFCLVISDKGQYQREKDELLALEFQFPVYLLHLEAKPPIYQDALLETLKKCKGGIVSELNDLEERLLFLQIQKENPNYLAFSDGQLYYTEEDSLKPMDSPFEALAFSKFIASYEVGDTSSLSSLDFVHSLAQKAHIVSPYSSMIVLVNDRQQRALDEAENKKDRFDREVESGNENLPTPNNLFEVSGTPEPHEWILLFIVFGFLGFHFWKKKGGVIKSMI